MGTIFKFRPAWIAPLIASGLLVRSVGGDCPDYAWTYTAGDEDDQAGFAVTLDDAGRVITSGAFEGTVDFDPEGAGDVRTSHGRRDVFAVKLGANATHEWTWAIGGRETDVAAAAVLDPSGNILLAGTYGFGASASERVNFDPDGRGDFHPVGNCFVTKLGSDGSYGWTRTFRSERRGGPLYDGQSTDVGVDSTGTVYVTGFFRYRTNFDPDGQGDVRSPVGFTDGFVTSLSAEGSYRWTGTFGGPSGSVRPFGISVDEGGNSYTYGDFQGEIDFDPGPGEDIHSFGELRGVFITKLHADGSYAWTRVVGPSGSDTGGDIVVSSTGMVYAAANFSGTVDFDPTNGVDLHTSNGLGDAFLLSLNADGSYRWARTFGSSTMWDRAYGVTVGPRGQVLVTGAFGGTVDFDPGPGVDLHTANGVFDIYVTMFWADGTHVGAITIGGSGIDIGYDAAANSAGETAITRLFFETVDFDPGAGLDLRTSNGRADLFTTKWSNRCTGDMNCDNRFNGADIDPFFLALGDPAAWRAAFPNCDILNGDMNRDGELNGADIDVFFLCLGGRCP